MNLKDELITINENLCVKCGLCARVCPMQLKPHIESINEFNQLHNLDCIKCKFCVKSCPQKALTLEHRREFPIKQTRTDAAKATITKVTQLSHNIRELTFETKINLNYIPGQYI